MSSCLEVISYAAVKLESTIERVNEYSILEEKHCDPEEQFAAAKSAFKNEEKASKQAQKCNMKHMI